jgi:AbrB family looped-hinge helix DNA binding protein
MRFSSTVSTKGQVTIPLEIRTRLGLREGDRVLFIVDGDRTIIRPERERQSAFRKYAGALGTFPGGPAEINAWVADLRSDD